MSRVTSPSLTPHRDAVIAGIGMTPAPANAFEAAVFRINNVFLLEIADIMDSGRGSDEALSFAVSVAASTLDTVASSEAAGHPDAADRRVRTLQKMIFFMGKALAQNTPVTVMTEVHHTPGGTA